jgi:hypothetical protein
MMDRLKAAHEEFFSVPAEEKKAALDRYLETLVQFNALLAHGELPSADNSTGGHARPEHGRLAD